MITITKQNDGVLFTFENSDKYLYGNGSILVPFNTLSIVADESDMITLKKAASNDVFLSARYDTDFGYRSKDDAIDELKGMLFAETGGGGSESGITSGEVQTMIDNSLEDYYTDDEVDAALSGKADTSDVTAVANDVQTVSGQVQTKVATSDFNAYSAATATALGNKADASALTAHADNTNVHFSGTQKSNYDNLEGQYYFDDSWDIMPMSVFNDFTNDYSVAMGQFDQRISANTNAIAAKQDALSAGTGIEISGNVISATGGGGVTVDTSLDSGSTNPVANSAITAAMNAKAELSNTITDVRVYDSLYGRSLQKKVGNGGYSAVLYYGHINGANIVESNRNSIPDFQLVEKSAITSAITSASTNDEVAGAKAVYDAIQAGGGGGGSVTVDSTLDSGSTNPVANSAITNAITTHTADTTVHVTAADKSLWNGAASEATTALDLLGGLKLRRISQAEYDELVNDGMVDSDTLYIISNVVA